MNGNCGDVPFVWAVIFVLVTALHRGLRSPRLKLLELWRDISAAKYGVSGFVESWADLKDTFLFLAVFPNEKHWLANLSNPLIASFDLDREHFTMPFKVKNLKVI